MITTNDDYIQLTMYIHVNNLSFFVEVLEMNGIHLELPEELRKLVNFMKENEPNDPNMIN